VLILRVHVPEMAVRRSYSTGNIHAVIDEDSSAVLLVLLAVKKEGVKGKRRSFDCALFNSRTGSGVNER
jgi:hypothetical protein